eukprot:CAMPEP_0194330432 /NCGR_PEP_ID=MMETSP0171-20130528/51984_1 /TAXON_ID=218684 /ORGANISM="Corethron pennatum, Strain L29A3" /LENGTH=138 /DNA_ID=CAMNT_0039091529 /DNA_START=1255 /DNA_END=1672 /DNA_ORIENTATION=-
MAGEYRSIAPTDGPLRQPGSDRALVLFDRRHLRAPQIYNGHTAGRRTAVGTWCGSGRRAGTAGWDREGCIRVRADVLPPPHTFFLPPRDESFGGRAFFSPKKSRSSHGGGGAGEKWHGQRGGSTHGKSGVLDLSVHGW